MSDSVITPNAWPSGETRAYVGTDFGRYHGITIFLTVGLPNGNSAIGQPVAIAFTELEGVDNSYVQDPTLRLPDHIGRALLDALSAHYGGVADVRQNREDLLAERKRVDALVGVVSQIALKGGQA